MADYDAIVVGAGHNGLTCALYLAEAGWRVCVLERGAEIGGGLRTAEVTLPGFRHDLYATNLTLFSKSPVIADFRAAFEQAGVSFVSNGFPYASAYAGGACARVYTEAARTEAEMARHAPEDLAGWRATVALFRRTAARFLPLFNTELPSADALAKVARMAAAGPIDALRVANIFWQTPRQFGQRRFRTEAVRGLFAPWSFHLDYGPDVPGGAMFSFINGMSAYLGGMCVVAGGAGNIPAAFRALIEARGGTIVTGAEVTRIRIERGRAVAVETRDGETIGAARAIVAEVAPPRLFGGLVAERDLPAGFMLRMRRYRYGVGTFVVHLALGERLKWRAAEDLSEFNYVHICGATADIERTYAESLKGLLPARPMLIFSQTTQVDPTRAPEGRHIARLHVRAVPRHIAGDAAGTIAGRDWADVKEAFADRLVDLVAEHAPNVKDALLARHVVSTAELEAINPNFVDGDCNGGSHHPDQNFFRRPIPGWSRYRTPIEGLYQASAATWPGGGVHGAAGHLIARRLLA